MKLLLSLCGLLLYHGYIQSVFGGPFKGVNYKLSVLSDNIITPCEQSPNNFVDRVFDLSNVTVSYVNDDELLIKGTLKYIRNDKIDGKISLDVQLFKKQRGEWTPTLYNFYRTDICASLWNPIELWYKLAAKIPGDMRTCPPDIKSTYNVNFVADLIMKNIPDRHAEGDYMAQAIISYGSLPDDFFCINMLCFMEKI